jgi:DMSO/TMAO reductase YedYZ molybdopterin-dependent catalytic subunit
MLFEGNERKEREHEMRQAGRLPPGQSLTLKWPVLHYGSVPRFDAAKWDFRIWGLVASPLRLSWEEFNRLPTSQVSSDFHCVTRWSRFDNSWTGVPFREVLKQVQLHPGAKYTLVHAEQGYTANIPLADLFLDHDQAGFWEQNGYHMYGDPFQEQRFSE